MMGMPRKRYPDNRVKRKRTDRTSVSVKPEVIALLDKEAKRLGRTRFYVVNWILGNTLP